MWFKHRSLKTEDEIEEITEIPKKKANGCCKDVVVVVV